MRVAIVGLGTTGKVVAEYLLEQSVLCMAICKSGSTKANRDLGEILHRETIGVVVDTCEHLESKLFEKKPNVLIDFSHPDFLADNIKPIVKNGVHVVTAVTGYSTLQIEKIRSTVQMGKTGLVFAPNITYGVNVLMLLAKLAAEIQKDVDIEIIEEHHNRKKDSPSGTAAKIANKIYDTGYDKTKIPIHSIRSGGIIGKHKVLMCGEFDQIEITHTSFSRYAFAQGAYKAANFIHNRVGIYEMNDVFELERIGHNECHDEKLGLNLICATE